MNESSPDLLLSGNRPVDSLFRPFNIKSLNLPNRIVMSPMGRAFAKNGVLEPDCADYYRRRVEGGTALITGEAAGIDPVSLSASNAPFFYGEAALAAWEDACRKVRDAGGYFMPQLWHAGLGRSPGTGPFPDLPSKGPSGVFLPNVDNQLRVQPERIIGDPMTLAEIEAVINAYGDAAAAAQHMGCAGVNVHGGHGYLIDQFLWSRSNRRTDAYGGSLANRARFAVDVIKEIRRRVGPDFPIFMRLSQWKVQDYEARIAETPDELAQLLEPMADAGVDLFDCSTRRFWEPEFPGRGQYIERTQIYAKRRQPRSGVGKHPFVVHPGWRQGFPP